MEEVVHYDNSNDQFHCGFCGEEVDMECDGDYDISYWGICYSCRASIYATPVKYKVFTHYMDPDDEEYNELFGDC